jgi:hypothetical protein
MANNGIDGTIEPAALSDLPTEAELAEAQNLMEGIRAQFPYELQLSYPIQAHGEPTRTLTLQVPRTGDVFHSGGDPFVDGPGKPADLRRLVPLVSRLAAIPESSVKQLAITDIKAIEFLLTPLFAPSVASLRRMLSTLRVSSTVSAP